MFKLSCSTCEAKLVVGDKTLVGKIVTCPNCGSMVFVQPDEVAPVSPPVPPQKRMVHKRFPDVLTHETASGVMSPVPEQKRRIAVLLDVDSADADSETTLSVAEVKARKVLVGILVGLSVLLLAALGFLMLFRKPAPLPPPAPEPAVQVPADVPMLVEQPPIVPNLDAPLNADSLDATLPEVNPPQTISPEEFIDVELIDVPLSGSAPQEIAMGTPLTTPPQASEISESESMQEETLNRNTEDTLTIFEEKMPGFVDISVPNIDIDEKLSLPILDLNVNQSRLISFVRVMSRLTEIPMTLDVDEMKPRALSAQTPASGQFREASAETILTETLAALGLQWRVADRQILISPKETADKIDLTFDVSDFAASTDDLTPEVLADRIQKLVCPEDEVIVLPLNRLMVSASQSSRKSLKRQQDEILRFLEQLRMVRQLPQQTKRTGETLAPEAFGWDRVMETITLNYYQAVPLSRAVAQLETLTKLTIIVDHQSLHRSLCSFASLQASVQCERGTVNDAMELLLASVDAAALTYRIIDHQTLEITTAEAARQPEKMVVEIHPYQLREEETPEEIVRLLRSAIAPESWAMAESSDTKHNSNIVIDEPSRCLLIRQCQPIQRQIRLYLSQSEWLER